MVYANPPAVSALRDDRVRTFPVGSIIAKEKRDSPQARADGVAFMIKRPDGQFVESGGWEFVYRAKATGTGSYDGCITCHRVGGKKDYVFGRYGRQSAN